MAPRDNQELVPLTDGSGRANDDELEAQYQKKLQAGVEPYALDDTREQLLQQVPLSDTMKSLLACQMIIGMGTLWRFPYVCLKYGGGKLFFFRFWTYQGTYWFHNDVFIFVCICIHFFG